MAQSLIAKILPAVFLLAAMSAAHAQDKGEIDGHRYVLKSCFACHADRKLSLAKNGAPTFAAIAADPTVTGFSLRVFLQTPHARMPNFILTADQISDTIAYIEKFREK